MTDNFDASVTETQSLFPCNESWKQLGVHVYAKILIIFLLFYYLFNNEIKNIVERWITDPSWSHGFLISFFSLYFINQHKKEILNLRTKPNYLGLVFMLCAIVFYPLNVVHFRYGYLKPIDMIATLGTIVLFLGGWKLVKYLWLPVVYLIFAVPLPQRFYFAVTMPMRMLASRVSTVLMNLVDGMDATANGVIIDVFYNGQRLEPSLNVAEACSGMRLLMAFLALGVAMAYLHYRPMWQRIILLATTIPIAIFCNIVRVAVTGFIYVLGNPKYAQGIFHDGLGMMMLLLAFALYSAIAWFMSSLFIDEDNVVVEDVVVRRQK